MPWNPVVVPDAAASGRAKARGIREIGNILGNVTQQAFSAYEQSKQSEAHKENLFNDIKTTVLTEDTLSKAGVPEEQRGELEQWFQYREGEDKAAYEARVAPAARNLKLAEFYSQKYPGIKTSLSEITSYKDTEAFLKTIDAKGVMLGREKALGPMGGLQGEQTPPPDAPPTGQPPMEQPPTGQPAQPQRDPAEAARGLMNNRPQNAMSGIPSGAMGGYAQARQDMTADAGGDLEGFTPRPRGGAAGAATPPPPPAQQMASQAASQQAQEEQQGMRYIDTVFQGLPETYGPMVDRLKQQFAADPDMTLPDLHKEANKLFDEYIKREEQMQKLQKLQQQKTRESETAFDRKKELQRMRDDAAMDRTIAGARTRAASRPPEEPESQLADEYNRAIRRLQNSNMANLPPEMQKQMEKEVFDYSLAQAIQSRAGGASVISDQEAISEAQQTRQIRDTFRTLQQMDQGAKGAGEEGVDNSQIVMQYVEALPAKAEQYVKNWLDSGATVEQILAGIERKIGELGVESY